MFDIKFGEVSSFISTNLILELHHPTLFELVFTLVSLHSLKLCICLDLASMHTLGVLDDAPSSLVASCLFKFKYPWRELYVEYMQLMSIGRGYIGIFILV